MCFYSLTYIYHDCFVLETQNLIIIFDYWKDPLSKPHEKDFPPLLKEIELQKTVYILVSHHHKDHFSRRIFLWEQEIPNVNYIISRDVYRNVRYILDEKTTYKGYHPDKNKIHILEPGEIYEDSKIKITAFPSTDIGNSYAVECDGIKVFHAGDLNAWLWISESTPEEVEKSRKSFVDIIESIREKFNHFDIAMFPVDSRQGEEYWWGASYFVNKIFTSLFVPMHFELVLSEEEKEQRRLDAAKFSKYRRSDFGAYLQLASSRSCFIKSIGNKLGECN